MQSGTAGTTVRYVETTPPEPGAAAHQITAPYAVRLIHLSDQQVTFIPEQR